MPDPESLLPPTGDHPPTARASKLTCEHCECVLTPTGDVLKMSDKARGHLKHDEAITKAQERIAALETELRDARAKLTELATVRESPFDLHL